jgi:hypothetical protein
VNVLQAVGLEMLSEARRMGEIMKGVSTNKEKQVAKN